MRAVICTAYGTTKVELQLGAGQVRSLSVEEAAARYMKVLRDATHGHGSNKEHSRALTDALKTRIMTATSRMMSVCLRTCIFSTFWRTPIDSEGRSIEAGSSAAIANRSCRAQRSSIPINCPHNSVSPT
jgi:hypothetical protein